MEQFEFVYLLTIIEYHVRKHELPDVISLNKIIPDLINADVTAFNTAAEYLLVTVSLEEHIQRANIQMIN